MVNDLAGIVDPKDILDYKALNVDGIKETYENYEIITAGEGSGGPLLVGNMKYINKSLPSLSSAVLGFKRKLVNFVLKLSLILTHLLLKFITCWLDVAEGWRVSTASHIAAVDDNDVYVTMVR